MKKKLPILLTVITLILSCQMSFAGAETAFAAPFPAGSAEAALAARIAETLGLDFIPADETANISESRAEAANRMLAEPGTILCDTQAALMAGLQGYTNEDLRTAMVPICRIARCPLYLVMDSGAAAEKGITDGESFRSYLAGNEYDDGLLLARHVEADPSDRAAVMLTNELPLLTDVFWPNDIPDTLKAGDAALAVYTEAELNAAAPEDLLVLFALGSARTETHPEVPAITESGLTACPEPALYLMTKTGAAQDLLDDTAQRISGATLSPDCLSAGFVFDPLSGNALNEEIAAIFADYVDYMTAEGLYFYEQ